MRRNAGLTTGSGAGLVLLVLAAGQFLMTLDSSVMNVSMAAVASDLGTTITGIQTAITLYTLVMATLMITGGKIGSILGRRRAFAIGLVVYGAGSFTTALAPNLPVLLVGWSLLEGIGAALIMPAIVALVASNFAAERRPGAYGLIAAAGAVAVAAGPLIGGAVTTFASWRYVFAGEVVLVVLILPVLRRIEDVPASRVRLDLVGSVLSVVGLGLAVFAVLRSGEWGWLRGRPGSPEILGLSPVFWLILTGLLVVYVFIQWESHVARTGREPLLDTSLLANRQLSGGLAMFFAQFIVQAGVFFAVPLFLSVVLELSALQTGIRLFPLSLALLLAAIGIPRLRPHASPRRVVRLGLASMIVGIVILAGGMSPGADAEVVAIPMVLMGLGLGALASQLGAVTVSAVPDSRSAEVGGLQNTATNLGASLGTALIGSVLIATLSASVIAGIENDPRVPDSVRSQATTELTGGVPFLSDTQLRTALDGASVDPTVADAVVEANSDARLEALQGAFSVAALLAVSALFFTGRLPRRAPGDPET
ncbi:MFS transporter [Rhodococcus sp. ABRD24]|uniref:MFS transporter n=1 Tax=Rhodococcus sp. ABRD24 TaxID=2507582 RepID=UPI00103AA676|nr:MFS transporter [Rhodococcus sp. ABRD24]QBJ96290.1 MFS transporter [Rhodococcus sp. ABRD24]